MTGDIQTAPQETPAFEIQFEATDADLSRALFCYWKRHLSRHWLTWLLIGLTLLGAYQFYVGDPSNAVRYLAGAALGSTLLIYAVWKNFRLVYNHHTKLGDRTLTARFFDRYLQSESGDRTLNIPWRFILKVWCLRDVWFLFFSRDQYYMLPAARLNEDLRAFIRDRISHGKRTDFLRCRRCRFSLVGCAQRTCPKCDHPLPLDDMGISTEQYYALTTALAQGVAGKVFNRKLLLVRKDYFWTWWVILLAGVCSGVLTLGSMLAAVRFGAPIVVLPALLLFMPAVVVALIGSHIQSWRGVLVFAGGHGALICMLAGLGGLLMMLRGAGGMTALKLLLICGYGSLTPILFDWVAWRMGERIRGSPVRAQAFRCSGCGYALIGNESGACPECGTPIPYQRLGLSKEQFDDLAAQSSQLKIDKS